ncbi:hypothetical protein Tco_0658295 [Tanacetum coccineum]
MIISRIYMLYMNCIGYLLSRIMNPQETEHVIARDELWVPTAEKVNISTTNVRLETTVKQKKETFQVVIDVIKNSTYIKAFTISADVPEILMQQFWYTITKIKGSESYEFLLADKRSTSQIYKYVCGPHASALEDSGSLHQQVSKTTNNDKLRKSRIDILWGHVL